MTQTFYVEFCEQDMLSQILQVLQGLCGRRAIVECVERDSAYIRIQGMTNDFAFATLKYSVINPAICARVEDECEATLDTFDSEEDDAEWGDIFVLLTAEHDLVVTTDLDAHSHSQPMESISLNFA